MNSKVWILAAALAGLSAPLSAQSVKAGIDAWQRADYGAAVEIWRPLAEGGDADAAFNLGQAYRLGRGVQTSLSAAKAWFERAASTGHVDAQTTLGLLLFQNGDQAAGLKWLKQAAEQGEARALLVYGTALYNGDGLTQDQVLGYAYVSRAAAQGLGPAKETLAQLNKLMPLEDRKKGLALAKSKSKSAPPPESKPAKPVRVASVRGEPAPKPARKPAAAAAEPATKETAPRVTLNGAWRIQLGAFSQRGAAEALYKKLSRNGAVNGRQAFYIPAGSITRLQIGPFESRAAAEAACKSLGTACFPVPAK